METCSHFRREKIRKERVEFLTQYLSQVRMGSGSSLSQLLATRGPEVSAVRIAEEAITHSHTMEKKSLFSFLVLS